MENCSLDYEQYEDEKYFKKDKKVILLVKLLIGVIPYLVLLFMQRWLNDNVQGIVAQLQVMISVFLTIYLNKTGYVTAIILNILQITFELVYLLTSHNIIVILGMIVSLTTILTISILHRYNKKLSDKIKKIINQKQELAMLNEELIAFEDELGQQNKRLEQNNKLLEENADRINKLAFYDTLTGIPNRIQVINKLEVLSKTSKYTNISYFLMMIDIDDFQYINDTLGHQVGDLVLQNIVNELKKSIHNKDFLGRFGEDEFALVVTRPICEEELISYISQLKASLQRVTSINNNKISITASFGIAVYPKDSSDFIELIKYADTAMNKAKESGSNNILFFNSKMKEEVMRKKEFENQLLSAIEKNELYLLFQPQYHSEDKQLRGYEALARWNSSVYGEVSPQKFIPITEENGFIIVMGNWILHKACCLFQEYLSRTGLKVSVSVNISPKQIMDPGFMDTVRSALEQSGLPPQYLELELTESILIDEVDYVCGILKILREMGVRVALDDFGMGYSSLSLLPKLPIDTLKIDKSFIQNIGREEKTNHLIDAIIFLAQKFNFFIIAEGIETEKQLEQLKAQKCDCIQGFLWGKPGKLQM